MCTLCFVFQGGTADATGPASPQPSRPQPSQAAFGTATDSPAAESATADCTPAGNGQSSPAAASSQAINSEQAAPAGNTSAVSPGNDSQPSQHPGLRVSDRGAASLLSDMPAGTSQAVPAAEIQAAASVSASPFSHGVQPGSRPVDQSVAAQREQPGAVPFYLREQVIFCLSASLSHAADNVQNLTCLIAAFSQWTELPYVASNVDLCNLLSV